MQRAKPNLRSVDRKPEPEPSYAYESEHRNLVMSRDWETVHIEAHRRKPFAFFSRRP